MDQVQHIIEKRVQDEVEKRSSLSIAAASQQNFIAEISKEIERRSRGNSAHQADEDYDKELYQKNR